MFIGVGFFARLDSTGFSFIVCNNHHTFVPRTTNARTHSTPTSAIICCRAKCKGRSCATAVSTTPRSPQNRRRLGRRPSTRPACPSPRIRLTSDGPRISISPQIGCRRRSRSPTSSSFTSTSTLHCLVPHCPDRSTFQSLESLNQATQSLNL